MQQTQMVSTTQVRMVTEAASRQVPITVLASNAPSPTAQGSPQQ